MTENIQARILTRRQVMAWSAFTLPKAALSEIPASVRPASVRVPGLTYEQLRTLDRRGLFRDYVLKEQRSGARLAFVIWKATRRGDTQLYSIEHLFLARLVGWMLHAGLSMQEVTTVIRDGHIAVTFIASNAEAVVVTRHARTINGCTSNSEAVRSWRALSAAFPVPPSMWVFPIAYLGFRQTMPKLRKELEREPLVRRWNREWSPAALTAAQAAAAVELRV